MTDFSRYLIVSDLDGTFLNRKRQVAPQNLQALERFRQGGGLFTIATGRMHINIRPLIPDIDHVLNIPAVLCNGACIYDFAERKIHHETLLSEQDATDLLTFAATKAPDVLIYVLARRQIRFSAFTEETRRYITFCEAGSVLISSPITWPRNDWHKIVLRGTQERLAQVRRALEEQFKNRFTVTTSSSRALEIQSATCTKASGISLLRSLNEDLGARTLIACGDYENDTEMLHAADVAICPQNASPTIKSIAHKTLCDCDRGLIAHVIAQIEAGEIAPIKGEALL